MAQDGFDASAGLAAAALIVAAGAFLIALAQVVQQYFSTGQLIRLCDSVVFSFFPGKGHRIWQMSQFRFRVVYSLPQIMLPDHFWDYLSIEYFPRSSHPAAEIYHLSDPYLYKWDTSLRKRRFLVTHSSSHPEKNQERMIHPTTGEASWVSFFRPVLWTFYPMLVYNTIENDADRCPSDLPSVPMPVSLRDIIVIAYALGMKCSSADFHEQSLFLTGPIGSLTSSRHPILGPVLHFNPYPSSTMHRHLNGLLRLGIKDKISPEWASRMTGHAVIGQQIYSRRRRRAVHAIAARWISRPRRATGENEERDGKTDDGPTTRGSIGVPVTIPDGRMADAIRRLNKAKSETKTFKASAAVPRSIPSGPHDGSWRLEDYRRPTSVYRDKSERVGHTTEDGVGAPPKTSRDPSNQPGMETVEDKRWQSSQRQQTLRSDKVKTATADEEMVKKASDRGDIAPIPLFGAIPLLISDKPHQPAKSTAESAASTAADKTVEIDHVMEAAERERERKKAREQRENERTERQKRASKDTQYNNVDWFWMSQINVCPGYWVTPWTSPAFHNFNFDWTDCVGAIAVSFEGLMGLVSKDTIRFVPNGIGWPFERLDWLAAGKPTWPAYAENARSGVVCSGTYSTVENKAFSEPMPVLTLYNDYKTQVSNWRDSANETFEHAMLELMGIDAWLSLTGRMQEITDGRNMLLQQTATMVEMIFQEFQLDFSFLWLSAEEGGYADIQAVTATVMDFMAAEELSDAEMIYVLVAIMRTAKVAQCVLNGADSHIVYDFLHSDIQAHLV